MLSWIAEKVTDTAKYLLGIHEVDLHPEQESVAEPGAKSIISGSFDEIEPKITMERFLDEVESSLRWPIDPITEYVLKECDVKENGPDEWIVKVILDGKKLDSWGRGRGDGCDRVKTWKKVCIDRKALRLSTEDYVPEATYGEWIDKCDDKTVVAKFHMAMHKEPSRFECWLIKGEERIAHQDFANYMYNWTDPMIKGIKAEILAKVHAKVEPSIKDPSVNSVISEPLDEFTDYDTYFESMVAKTRDFFARLPDTVVEDVSETEFAAKTTVKDGEEKETVMPKQIKFNQETGEMQITFQSADAKTQQTVYRVLHKSPLRLEAWTVNESGERKFPPTFVKQIAREVNDTIG